MPLTQGEKDEVAVALLNCFGEDINGMGRTLAYLDEFTTGQVNLLAEVQEQSLTFQPFLDSGVSINPGLWQEWERIFTSTLAGID